MMLGRWTVRADTLILTWLTYRKKLEGDTSGSIVYRDYFGDTATIKNMVLENANAKFLIRGDSLFSISYNPVYFPSQHNFVMTYKSSYFEVDLDKFTFPQ